MPRRISIVTLDNESARDCPPPIHVARPRRVAFRRALSLGHGLVLARQDILSAWEQVRSSEELAVARASRLLCVENYLD
jgi:hypothetical protein